MSFLTCHFQKMRSIVFALLHLLCGRMAYAWLFSNLTHHFYVLVEEGCAVEGAVLVD